MDRRVIMHIGYFQTGTTWFQQVFFPKVSNAAFNNKANSSLDDNLIIDRPYDFSAIQVATHIEELFKNDVSKTLILSIKRLSGHSFTGGYDSKIITGRLKETYPNADDCYFYKRTN